MNSKHPRKEKKILIAYISATSPSNGTITLNEVQCPHFKIESLFQNMTILLMSHFKAAKAIQYSRPDLAASLFIIFGVYILQPSLGLRSMPVLTAVLQHNKYLIAFFLCQDEAERTGRVAVLACVFVGE